MTAFEKKKPRVAVISANRLFRDTLGDLAEENGGQLSWSGPVSEIACLPTNIDLVLIDAVDARSRVLMEIKPRLIIIINADWAGLDIAECVRLGVNGFILTDATSDAFISTMIAVVEGREVFPSSIVEKLMNQLRRQEAKDCLITTDEPHLTTKEYQVLRLLADGLTNKEIANKLSISEYTVKNHVHHILQKLKCRSRADIVRKMLSTSSWQDESDRLVRTIYRH